MQVKISVFLTLCLTFAGCRAAELASPPRFRVLELPGQRAGSFSSLLASGDWLFAVTSDLESTSLTVTEVPLENGELPLEAPSVGFWDKIDVAPTQAQDFGLHVGAVIGTNVHLLYVDRKKDDGRILKWLIRAADGSWTVDTLEPPGTPLAILPDANGTPVAFWSTDALYMQPLADNGAARTVLSPFSPASRASVAGKGFTVYDQFSHSLLYIFFRDGTVAVQQIPGVKPLHSSTLTSQGTLAVATYDAETKRIILLEQPAQGGTPKSITVALNEGTTSLFCTRYGSGYVFFYDGIKRLGRGRSAYALFLMVPEGRHYQRYVLREDAKPFIGLSVMVLGKMVYVLAMHSTLDLIQAALP